MPEPRRGAGRAGHPGRPPWGGDHDHTPEEWDRVRRRFVRRALVAVVLLVVLLALAVGGVVALLGGTVDGPGRLVGVVLLPVLLLVAVARLTLRWARPVGGVMSAADRVAAGDLAARADEQGPRAVRRLAASFNAMAQRIEADDRRRRRLLADVAHELRTPLSVVRGNLEGMLDGIYAPTDERLGRVLAEVVLAERLLTDLRTLSSAEVGALALDREDVSVRPLLERVAALHGPRAAAHGADVVVDAPEGLVADVDLVRIEQVLGNLVDNALRHADGLTRVELGAAPGGPGEVVLLVVDDGGGVADEVLPRAFERSSSAGSDAGTGLGLAIVRGLVEAHGGSASIARGPDGRGTRVELRLPAAG